MVSGAVWNVAVMCCGMARLTETSVVSGAVWNVAVMCCGMARLTDRNQCGQWRGVECGCDVQYDNGRVE